MTLDLDDLERLAAATSYDGSIMQKELRTALPGLIAECRRPSEERKRYMDVAFQAQQMAFEIVEQNDKLVEEITKLRAVVEEADKFWWCHTTLEPMTVRIEHTDPFVKVLKAWRGGS